MESSWDPAQRELRFQTPEFAGTLRGDGSHHGITRLTHTPSATPLVGSAGPLLGIYRLLCRDGWMGEAREMQHTVETSNTNSGLRLVWHPRPLHQARLTAVFILRPPNAVDLQIEVVGCGTYEAYEVFVANYFHALLRPGVYAVDEEHGRATGMERIEPEANPVYKGLYVTFPRDEAAAHMFTDGRWRRGRHAARFLATRQYALPLGYYRREENGVDVLLMGLRDHVAGVSMAYATDTVPPDDIASHHSLYFSLWGQNLRPGTVLRTVVRLAVGTWGGDPEAHRAQWETFAEQYVGALGSGEVEETGDLFRA